ncbi:hypothetical protein IAU59_004706 [Kwoniella sp. CBS 9459]
MSSSDTAPSPSASSESSDGLSPSPQTFDSSFSSGDYDHCLQLLLQEWGRKAFSDDIGREDAELMARRDELYDKVSEEDRAVLDTLLRYFKALSGEETLSEPWQLPDSQPSRKGHASSADSFDRSSHIAQLLNLRLSILFDAPLEDQLNLLKRKGKSTHTFKGLDWEMEWAFLNLVVAIQNGTFTEDAESEAGIYYHNLQQHVDNPHFRARLDVLHALLRINAGFIEAISTIDGVISYLEKGGYHTYAGLLSYQTARKILAQTRSARLAAGFGEAAFEAYSKAGLKGVCRHLMQKTSDQPSDRLDGAGENTAPLRRISDIQMEESPPTERFKRSLSIDGDASQSDQRMSQAEDLDHVTLRRDGDDHRARTSKRDKSSLDPLSLLRATVALAGQEDPSILRVKLLETLCQILRAEYAALATYVGDKEKKLRLKAAGARGNIAPQDLTMNDEKCKAACPVKYLKHVANTGQAITKPSELSRIGHEPFYSQISLAGIICVPVTAYGRKLGVLLLSSPKQFEHDPSPDVVEITTSLSALGVLLAQHLETALSIRRDHENQAEELQKLVHAKTQFLSQCSHELRSPLSAVLGLSAVLDASPGLSGVQREHIQIIRSSANDLLGLINNILDHSRLESDSVVLERIQFSLRDVVETALNTIAPSAQGKNVELGLTNAFNEDPPDLIGDPFRVKQILLNLLSNAVKFTPKGRVAIEWKYEEINGKVKIDLAVKDTGIGIPAGKMNKLFKSFSQVDSSVTRNHGGSGLGLIISKDMAKLLGGDCTAESELDKGSIFHFSFVADKSATKDTQWDLFTQRKSCFIICAPDPWWEMLNRNLTALGCHPLRFEEDINKSLIKDHPGGLDSSKRFDFILIDTQCITPPILQKMKKLQPSAKFIYLAKIIALGEVMKEFNLGRDEIVARPIKFASLYKALMDPSLSHDVSKSAKPPNQGNKLVDRGLAKACPLKILLVDDNVVNISVGKRLLELFGYTSVDSALGGQQAIEMAQEKTYDVVLLDLQMPVLDGFSTRKQLKENPNVGDPHVVALSANVDQATKQRCAAADFFDYLSKPMDIPKLADILTRVYAERQDTRRNSVEVMQS